MSEQQFNTPIQTTELLGEINNSNEMRGIQQTEKRIHFFIFSVIKNYNNNNKFIFANVRI
jgi:hypothetical protein